MHSSSRRAYFRRNSYGKLTVESIRIFLIRMHCVWRIEERPKDLKAWSRNIADEQGTLWFLETLLYSVVKTELERILVNWYGDAIGSQEEHVHASGQGMWYFYSYTIFIILRILSLLWVNHSAVEMKLRLKMVKMREWSVQYGKVCDIFLYYYYFMYII